MSFLQKMRSCFHQYYNELGDFSIGSLALGIELSFLLNLSAVILFSITGSCNNPNDVHILANSLAASGLKILLLSFLISFVTDIVVKAEKRRSDRL